LEEYKEMQGEKWSSSPSCSKKRREKPTQSSNTSKKQKTSSSSSIDRGEEVIDLTIDTPPKKSITTRQSRQLHSNVHPPQPQQQQPRITLGSLANSRTGVIQRPQQHNHPQQQQQRQQHQIQQQQQYRHPFRSNHMISDEAYLQMVLLSSFQNSPPPQYRTHSASSITSRTNMNRHNNSSDLGSYEQLLQLEDVAKGATQKQIETHTNVFVLDKIPETNNSEHKECCICTDAFEKGSQLRMLQCFHRFHLKCIDQWFERSKQCPICREDFLKS
jgi:hypothetical protein